MIIFLYGKDGYRLKQNLNKIVEEYKKKHVSGMSFSILDMTEGAPGGKFNELEDLVKTTSFFNEKRLVVIKNPFLMSNELAVFIKKWDLAEDKERIMICLEYQDEGELKKKNKTFYALLAAEHNVVKSFEPLSGKQLENWTTKEFIERGRTIEPVAVKKLISYTGEDSWLINQEVNKLVNYTNVESASVITAGDVDSLTTPKIDLNIFEVVDAVAGKHRLRAAKLLHNHLESGADPYYIFSMIVYQFRNLLRVKDLAKNAVPYDGIIRKTGLNPYVIKKTYEQCRGFERDELKDLFSKLADLDLAVKNGEAEITDGLFQFIFSLAT